MTNLAHHVVLDLASGTFFGADGAYIVDTRDIPDLEAFNEGSDSDRREIAEAVGTDLEHWSPLADSRALDAVADLLNQADWSSDSLDSVADMVRATGRAINDISQ